MKVTQVAIRATEASDAAGRPVLTPELLAAVGARYSRNNEGLDAILARIDPTNLDASVDGIFRMIDYGHQSIADMVPVAIFVDEISILLAYLVWSWCPTAGGQESSTRYIRMNSDGLVGPELFGVPEAERSEWYAFVHKCFDSYTRALEFWTRVAVEDPTLMRIPGELLNDPSEKTQKQVARMRRNFAFDRARYFLPAAAKTNMMMVMSARGWVQLCQRLLSHWLPEAVALGERIKAELGIAAPRMVRHANRTSSFVDGYANELQLLSLSAKSSKAVCGEAQCLPSIEIFPPSGLTEADLVESLVNHENRYDFIGLAISRTAARFSWSAMALAEIRDLNRHRTGQKYCPLLPVGFYCAMDQVPEAHSFDTSLTELGFESTQRARRRLIDGGSQFSAWLLLGTQFEFEQTTSLDKFVYEAELRTGPGGHFRYASHLQESVGLLGRRYPSLVRQIRLGLSEPE